MGSIKSVIGAGLLLLLSLALTAFASANPNLVERLYVPFFFRPLALLLSRLTGLLPFSLAELLVVALLGFLVFDLLYLAWIAWPKPRAAAKILLRLVTGATLLYALFIFLWGLNYHRQPLAHILELNVRPREAAELEELCRELLADAKALRAFMPEDSAGVTSISGGKWRALSRAELGYEELARIMPQVGGRFGRPKGVYLSRWWSYTGTAGMYFPYTAEANVNMAMPAHKIPAVVCHEMAHQRGFAREDEANYLAYLACSLHPDREFQYSGTLLALQEAMNALRRADEEAYLSLRLDYDARVLRDLAADRSFWQEFQGPVERASQKANDAYLKSNYQSDGVQSYGRMVDLLLAARR